jgi:hypothetical protein
LVVKLFMEFTANHITVNGKLELWFRLWIFWWSFLKINCVCRCGYCTILDLCNQSLLRLELMNLIGGWRTFTGLIQSKSVTNYILNTVTGTQDTTPLPAYKWAHVARSTYHRKNLCGPSPHHNAQTCPGALSFRYPEGARVSSSGLKWPGREANHWPISSEEIKNWWSCTSAQPYVCAVWWSIKHQRQLYLYIIALVIVDNIICKHSCVILYIMW